MAPLPEIVTVRDLGYTGMSRLQCLGVDVHIYMSEYLREKYGICHPCPNLMCLFQAEAGLL